ncbi:SPOR domain-containing protein [Gaetbulibacter sp. M235]|uniref:HU domain-containing protein n=1 Tax=Gaetbulibacter sp. M235 TaxID=3126510 RepID=UPI00374F66DC
MQLETYISDLLYRYECVTVPEFGAFLTQRASATINVSTNTFYPPNKTISFNEQIQKNDGLLAHYIADVEKIPFEVANEKIQKRVKILKALLTQGETLTFNNIGEVVFNNEGKIQFEPSYHHNYLTDAFGLSQFVSPAITREVYKETVEAIEKDVPIVFTPEKRKSIPYFRYAAVAVIALTLGGFVASNYYVNKIETHNQLAQEEALHQLDNKIQQATFVIENPLPAVTFNVTKQAGNYHVVAGAFRVEENCDKKIEQLVAEGFKARKLGVNKYGLHEVAYGSYETAEEALKALHTIRQNSNKDAWLKVDSDSKDSFGTISYKKEQTKAVATNQDNNSSDNENNPSSSETKKSNNLDFAESPNLIKIIKNIKTVESGYYLVLGAYSDTEKRDVFIDELKASSINDVGFFFDSVSNKYFVFYKKFDSLETAKQALQSKANLTYNGKIAIVKVEN